MCFLNPNLEVNFSVMTLDRFCFCFFFFSVVVAQSQSMEFLKMKYNIFSLKSF